MRIHANAHAWAWLFIWEPGLGCFKRWVEKGSGEFSFGVENGLTEVQDEGQGRNLGERGDQRLFFLLGLCVHRFEGPWPQGLTRKGKPWLVPGPQKWSE